MSNVLIGIIGVILFIGLALAGALFLGPRFQDATLNSKATAAIQTVSQIARAANLAYVETGTPLEDYPSIQSRLVSQGYLKSIPANPLNPTAPPTIAPGGSGSTAGSYVFLDIGTNNMPVCLAVARQTGQKISVDASGRESVPTDVDGRSSGCIKGPGTSDPAAVFSRI